MARTGTAQTMTRAGRGREHADTRRPVLPVVLGLLLLGMTLLFVQAVGLAFTLAGLNPYAAAVVLLAGLLGSVIDIPVARIARRPSRAVYRIRAWDATTVLVSVPEPRRTVVAVNLGGAVIPAGVSVYLAARTGLWVDAVAAVAVVGVVTHLLARPIPQVGITLPPLIPALTAAITATVLNPPQGAAALAYIAGTTGTLVGADLTHLGALRKMGAPVVSIGGAGTFDGVFLCGIFAVLLAAFL
ncbi:DUF1614 domain-containing protein [Actinoplanes sp. KI2]|uniref:DUF1614 domain-containing protein n=1 Tax=Actinoplanes sp. KI2 TaxID=2983315 RepID=UPI0021D5FFD2|nr:DUF1614 domain-containing protein [Actinoplanes sp. KI2]MCU7729452.1 DUF1614 domain-containing protein [Actinoplanes sp. KI2]